MIEARGVMDASIRADTPAGEEHPKKYGHRPWGRSTIASESPTIHETRANATMKAGAKTARPGAAASTRASNHSESQVTGQRAEHARRSERDQSPRSQGNAARSDAGQRGDHRDGLSGFLRTGQVIVNLDVAFARWHFCHGRH